MSTCPHINCVNHPCFFVEVFTKDVPQEKPCSYYKNKKDVKIIDKTEQPVYERPKRGRKKKTC